MANNAEKKHRQRLHFGKIYGPVRICTARAKVGFEAARTLEPHFAELAQNPRDELLHTELSSRTATTASVQPSSAMSSIGRVASGHRSEREG